MADRWRDCVFSAPLCIDDRGIVVSILSTLTLSVLLIDNGVVYCHVKYKGVDNGQF